MPTFVVNYVPGVVSQVDGGAGNDDTLVLNWGAASASQPLGSNVTNVATNADGSFISGTTGVNFTLIDHFQITSGASADTVITAGGNDTVSSGAGNDFIDTRAGAAIVDGGSGIDGWAANYGGLAGAITVNLATSTVAGLGASSIANIERLGITNNNFQTGSGSDTVTTRIGTANLYDDFISTNVGNDTVTVGGGIDEVDMGVGGDDLLIVNYSAFSEAIGTGAFGGGGADVSGSYARSGIDGVNFIGVKRFQILSGSGNDAINTGGGNDVISSGAGNDTLNGGLGNDTMTGGTGNDSYTVDSSADVVTEAAGGGTLDTVTTSVSFALAATSNVEVLQTSNEAATTAINLTGSSIVNTLRGNAGKNILDGKVGADSMTGFGGNDIYVVDLTTDRVIEAASGGLDLVKSSATFTLAVNVENLTLTGAAAIRGTGNATANTINGNNAANVLAGLAGNDTVNGGGGDDFIIGGLGKDSMNGGLGSDRFDFNTVAEIGKGIARDVIVGFTHLTDKIDLGTIDANGAAPGHTFTFLAANSAAFTGVAGQLRWFRDDQPGTADDKTIIEGDTNGNKVVDFQIQLAGLKSLTAADFVL